MDPGIRQYGKGSIVTGILWSAGAIGLVIGVIVRLLPWNPSAVVAGIVGVLVLGGGIVLAGAPDIGSLYGVYALSILCGLIGAVAGMAIPTFLTKSVPADSTAGTEDPFGAPVPGEPSAHRMSSHRSHHHRTSVH